MRTRTKLKASPELIMVMIHQIENELWKMRGYDDEARRHRLEADLTMLRDKWVAAMLPSEQVQ